MPAAAQTTQGIVTFGATSAVCPHAAWGGEWSTTLYVTATGAPATVTIRFFDAEGKPQTVPFTTTRGLAGRVADVTLNLGLGTTEAVEIGAGDKDTSMGWLTVKSTQGSSIQLYEVFRQAVPGRTPVEAFVSCATPSSGQLRQFTFDNRNGGDTGVAIVLPTRALTGHAMPEGSVNLRCFVNNLEVGRMSVHESPQIYSVFALTSRLSGTAGRLGYCTTESFDGTGSIGPVVAALHFTSDGAFSSVPVALR
ncbi:MAG: hypothetical protein SGI92_32435 [Bryobacteraceae bacterium]|nr:hypothetical protein [Bryobacteraceae bacterium]